MHKLIAEMNVSEMPAIRKKLKVDMCIEKNSDSQRIYEGWVGLFSL